jgi:hypothetical protein
MSNLLLYVSRELIKYNLQNYNQTPAEYRIHIINNIIFGKKKKIVARFKDSLVYLDSHEFLKK